MNKRPNKGLNKKERRLKRYRDFIESLEKETKEVRKFMRQYLGIERYKKPYSVRELAIYWNIDEDIVRSILREVINSEERGN